MKIFSYINKKIFVKQSFIFNFLTLAFGNFMQNIANLFINMYLARALEPYGFGEYGVLITWANILLTFSSFGVDQVITRSVAIDQANSRYYFTISNIIRLWGIILTSLLFLLYCRYVEEIEHIYLVFIICNTIFLSFWNSIQSITFGMKRMESTGLINAAGSFLILLIYIFMPQSLTNVLTVYIIFVLIQMFKDVVYLFRSTSINVFKNEDGKSISMIDICDYFKESLPFYLLAIFGLFTNQLPVIFLSENSGTVEVAYFNSANKLLVPLSTLLTSMFLALFPKLVEERQESAKRFITDTNQVLLFIVLIGTFCCFCISLFRDDLVYLLYGEKYRGTGLIMLSQCWYVTYFSILSLFGNLYVVIKKDNILAYVSFLNAIIWTPLIWFGSMHGALMTSYGFVLGGIVNFCTNSVCFYFVEKSVFSLKYLSLVNIFILFGVIVSLFIPNSFPILYKIIILAILLVMYSTIFFKIKKQRYV